MICLYSKCSDFYFLCTSKRLLEVFASFCFFDIVLPCSGIPIDKVALLSQGVRDYVGEKLLELTFKELFAFQFMQASAILSSYT